MLEISSVNFIFEWKISFISLVWMSPACIYSSNVNNKNARTVCESCSKLTIRTPERRRHFGVFDVYSEQIKHQRHQNSHSLFWSFHCWLLTSICKKVRKAMYSFQLEMRLSFAFNIIFENKYRHFENKSLCSLV